MLFLTEDYLKDLTSLMRQISVCHIEDYEE